MKAITISQPYASLIANGEKWIENRTWATQFRGLIAIHAGSGSQYLLKSELKKYPLGCVVAVGRLSACCTKGSIDNSAITNGRLVIPGTKVSWKMAAEHRHCEGPYCWVLENVKPIEPVEVPGAQRLWKLPIVIAMEVLARYGDQGEDVEEEMSELLEECIPTTPEGVAAREGVCGSRACRAASAIAGSQEGARGDQKAMRCEIEMKNWLSSCGSWPARSKQTMVLRSR